MNREIVRCLAKWPETDLPNHSPRVSFSELLGGNPIKHTEDKGEDEVPSHLSNSSLIYLCPLWALVCGVRHYLCRNCRAAFYFIMFQYWHFCDDFPEQISSWGLPHPCAYLVFKGHQDSWAHRTLWYVSCCAHYPPRGSMERAATAGSHCLLLWHHIMLNGAGWIMGDPLHVRQVKAKDTHGARHEDRCHNF